MGKTVHIHLHKAKDASTPADVMTGIQLVIRRLQQIGRIGPQPLKQRLDDVRTQLVAARNDIDGLMSSLRGMTTQDALSDAARQANVQIQAVKRYAASLPEIRPNDPELNAAEGALNDIAELEAIIARAKAALNRAG